MENLADPKVLVMRKYAYYADLSFKTKLLNAVRKGFRYQPLESLLRRMVNGRPSDSALARMVPPEYLYAKGSWRNLEYKGLKYHLDLSNATDHGAYYDLLDTGDDRLKSLVRPEHVIVDIGANIGIRSMAFAQMVPKGRVLSFEPDPNTFKRLKQHINSNALSNVETVNMGIGPKESTERLYQVVNSNSGMNRIVSDPSKMQDFAYSEVRITPLDPVLARLGITHVDVIKIDVEGFEMEVLKGCAAVLERDHPVLFIELDDDNLRENGSSATALLNWLVALGYDVERADTQEPVHIGPEHCHFDILCVRRT